MIKRFGLLVSTAASLLVLSPPAFADEAPAPDPGKNLAAQVTIPYQEFRRLLDAATVSTKPEDNPDLPGVVTRALIKLSLDPAHPSGQAEFEINTFGHKWVFVPFFGLNLPLTNVACESAVVLPRDGVLCLLTNRPGVNKVTLDFDLPGSFVTGAGEPISIELAAVTSGQLEFSNLPVGKRVLVGGKPADVNQPLPLSSQGEEIKVSCVADKPESPTVWSQVTQTLVKPNLESIEIETHIHLSGSSGSGLSASAELPVAATSVQVAGVDLQPAQISTSASGRKQITLAWETTGVLDRNIVVCYQLPNPEPDRPWEISIPRFGAELDPKASLIVISPLPGSAVQSESGQTESDISKLPYWIPPKLISPDFSLIYAANPVTVSTRLLPVLKPDNARVLTAVYQTGLVPDGSLKCEARFQIEYRSAFPWRFRLPNGSVLLDCQVNSDPTNPVVKTDGELELSIPPPANSGAVTSIAILISYTARGPQFEPVEGKRSLSLLSTPLFIEQLEWRLSLPVEYEATAFEGNVEPDAGDDTLIRFSKRLVRGDTPNLEIYYRKREAAPQTP